MSQPWLEEARRLRASGMTFRLIAAQVKRSECTVRVAINENGEDHNAGNRRRYQERKTAARSVSVKRRTITQDEKMAAARAFASGQIDRAELMRRITPT